MKNKMVFSALMVLMLSAGIVSSASAAPHRGYRGGYGRPHVAVRIMPPPPPRIFVPAPRVVIAPPMAMYHGGGYNRGYGHHHHHGGGYRQGYNNGPRGGYRR